MVRAKFVCSEITEQAGWNGGPARLYVARFRPVTQGSEENQRFYAATPSGGLELGTLAAKHFEVGREYYLDLVEAAPG